MATEMRAMSKLVGWLAGLRWAIVTGSALAAWWIIFGRYFGWVIYFARASEGVQNVIPDSIAGMVFGGLLGGAVGIAQRTILRRYFTPLNDWIDATCAGCAVGFGLCGAL